MKVDEAAHGEGELVHREGDEGGTTTSTILRCGSYPKSTIAQQPYDRAFLGTRPLGTQPYFKEMLVFTKIYHQVESSLFFHLVFPEEISLSLARELYRVMTDNEMRDS